jgi:hypothetical protein
MVNMRYRGYTSLYSYCADRSHKSKNNRCPSLRFAFNNVLAPNNSAKSKKMIYSNTIRYASRGVAARVIVCNK